MPLGPTLQLIEVKNSKEKELEPAKNDHACKYPSCQDSFLIYMYRNRIFRIQLRLAS